MNEILLVLFVKSVLLSILALVLAAGLRRFASRRVSAAMRHTVTLGMFAGLALLPVLSLTLPAWNIAPLAYSASGSRLPEPSLETPSSVERAAKRPSPVLQVAVLPDATVPAVSPDPAVSKIGTETIAWYVRSNYLPVLYFGFVFALLARLVVGHIGVWRIVRRARFIDMPVPIAIPVQESSEIAVPLTVGTGRSAVIVLPQGFAAAASLDQLSAVLAHETGHIQRRDYQSQLFADVVGTLYFLNPLVRLLVRVLRDEAERATDDHVLTTSTVLPSEYAGHLLETVRALQGRRGIPALAVTMARRSDVGARIQAILRGDTNRNDRPSGSLATTFALGGVGIIGIVAACAPVQGEISRRSDTDLAPFQKKLADGTVVTLLSVARGNTTRQAKPTFWKPTGEPIVGPRPYRARYSSTWKIDPTKPEMGYELAISLTGPRADFEIASRGAYSEYDATLRMTSQGSLPSNISVIQTKLGKQQDQTSLNIGVAQAKWSTIYTTSPEFSRLSVQPTAVAPNIFSDSLVLVHPHATTEGTVLTVVRDYPFKKDWRQSIQDRYVALLKNGKQVIGTPIMRLWTEQKSKYSVIVQFTHTTPAAIARIEIQARGFDWVTFSGIVLKPRLTDSVFQRNLANETTVEVVAITRHPSWKQPGGAHWWKPDGTPYVGTVPHAPTVKDNMGDHTNGSFARDMSRNTKPEMYEVMTRVTSPYTEYQRGDEWKTDSNTTYFGSLGPVEEEHGSTKRIVQTLFHYVAVKKGTRTTGLTWQMKPTLLPWENSSVQKVSLTGIMLHPQTEQSNANTPEQILK